MDALFEDFSASNATVWKERLAKDLKGITFEELQTLDRNGIFINPFYTSEDIAANNHSVFAHKDWIICSAIKVKDEKAANEKALNELQNGASGLCFELQGNIECSKLLEGIELQYIYTRFHITTDLAAFLKDWNEYLATQNIDATTIQFSIIHDNIQQYIASNTWSKDEAKQNFKTLLSATAAINIEATIYQNAGANSLSELACCIAQLNEYLYWAEASGQIDQVKNINISLSVSTDFFEEVAKLRALRILVANVLEQYKINPNISLHVATSDTYRSAADSYSNLLRDTVAGMAAVLGGCNSLLIHAFDQTKNAEPNEFSSRMARNQQLIFKEESYLNQIADAASGSFYIESLTEQLANSTWEEFKNIEKMGGLIAYFESGNLKAKIEQQAQQWIEAYQSGKRVLIGVNKYVDANDKPIANRGKENSGEGLNKINISEAIV
jgi:methylmalonyl-CoA mutase